MHYDAIVVLERLIVCFVCLLDRVVFVAMYECVQSDNEVPSFTRCRKTPRFPAFVIIKSTVFSSLGSICI